MSFDPKKWGILVVVLAVVGGVFGWWAYQSFGAGSFGVTLTNNTGLISGEVGHWTFDGKDINTTFNDISGRGNNATSTGFTSTTTIQGRVGQALNFSAASSQYLRLGSQTDFNFERTNPFSISAWVNKNSSATESTIFAKEGTACGPGYRLTLSDTLGNPTGINTVSLYLYNGANALLVSTVDNAVLPNRWYHVVATYDGSVSPSGVKLYVNNASSTALTVINTLGANTILNSQSATIGASCSGLGSWFNGSIDDVRVYNRVLSPQEVSRLYGMGGVANDVTVTTNQGAKNGEIVHWTFDGKDMNTTFNDISGNGNNATIYSGFGATSTAQGRVGQGFQLLTVATMVRSLANINLGTVSAAFWMRNQQAVAAAKYPLYLDTFAGGGASVGWSLHSDPSGNYIYPTIDTTGGGGSNGQNPCGGTGGNNVAFDGKWHFVVMTLGGGNCQLYVDSSLVASGTYNAGTSGIGANTQLTIGDSTNGYIGIIDDVRLYNRIISQTEILRLYGMGAAAKDVTVTTNQKNTSGELIHWTFDGKDTDWGSNTITDRSGGSNTGHLTSMSTSTSPVSGAIGQGLHFDGTTQYVVDSQVLNLSSATVSVWFKRKGNQNSTNFVAGFVDGNNASNYDKDLYVDANGNVGWYVYDGAGRTAGDTSTVVTDGKWHHLVGTADGTNAILYIDGRQLARAAAGATFTGYTVPDFQVGGNTTLYVLISDEVDDARVYNRALSPQEVSRLYGLGR